VAQSPTDKPSSCPRCGKPVDPLRAGAVSIVGGRIVYFCSAVCRETHLRRDVERPDVDGEPPAAADEERAVEPEVAEEPTTAPSAAVPQPVRPLPRRWLVQVVVAGLLVGAVIALGLVHRAWLGGMLLPGLAGLVALAALAVGIVGAHRLGPARIVEAAAIPLAAGAMVAVAMLEPDPRLPAMLAVLLVLGERAGRLLELAGRSRSGVADVLGGSPPLLLASEWRDNSLIAARIRQVTLALEWGRLPLAALIGFAVWLFAAAPISGALLAAATALVAINTRALRMVTGDAHLSVALAAARRGAVLRDAHAVSRIGAARVILFMTKRVLVSQRIEIVDWQVVEGVDEGAVLAALAGVESRTEGRIAAAITEYTSSLGTAPRDVDELVVRPGIGVSGQTQHGRLLCGGRAHLLAENVSTAEHEPWAAAVERSGRRALFVALGGRVVAMFGVEEEPVAEAREVARGLSSLGLEPTMITTAEVDAAQALGDRLEIENVRFETGEERLGAVLAEITGCGDTVLLVGHGPAFEESLRLATAGFALGSDEPTMAGVDARKLGIGEVLRVVRAARDARRSVVLNLVAAIAAAMVGIALSTGWHAPAVVVFAGILGFLASALSTFNGPYPLLEGFAGRINRLYGRFLKLVGLKRAAAP
jgi:hypothetical protein